MDDVEMIPKIYTCVNDKDYKNGKKMSEKKDESQSIIIYTHRHRQKHTCIQHACIHSIGNER